MPTYEYVCKNCEKTFEIFQSINDDHAQKCPECTGEINRVFSAGTGLIFKGSGFYITDYKKKEKGSAESNPS
jgi:putative FmdB family regulatory protein